MYGFRENRFKQNKIRIFVGKLQKKCLKVNINQIIVSSWLLGIREDIRLAAAFKSHPKSIAGRIRAGIKRNHSGVVPGLD